VEVPGLYNQAELLGVCLVSHSLIQITVLLLVGMAQSLEQQTLAIPGLYNQAELLEICMLSHLLIQIAVLLLVGMVQS